MLTVVLLTVGIAACGGQKFVDPGEEAAAASKNTEVFKIGVEDVLQINVWRNPDLSVSAPVRPDGKISVPLVGDVQAGGLTPTEVGDSIKQKLAVFIRDPNVTVILTNLRSAEFISRIRVTGAVRVQKSMPYRQGMTVLDAVLEAGGLNDFASANRTKLYRKKNLKTEVYSIDLGDILNKGKLDTNATLRPGDIITVPERLF
jgi:polysaccharide export outer membrane protein